MAARPTQVIRVAVLRPRRSRVGVATATRAPRANSQARVNGEKNAAVGDDEVWTADSKSDIRMIGTKMNTRRARSDTADRTDAITKKMAG